MKSSAILLGAAFLFSACEQRVETPANQPAVERNTTIVQPGEKKEEKNTTIVNPPSNTSTEEKSTTTTTEKTNP